MIPTERPLDNPINWSFRAGRVWGIDIRIHVTFLLGAVVVLWMAMPKPGAAAASVSFGSAAGDALATYAILFLIVLLHEFGHCWGARRVGGEADEVLLWPLGGLASVNPPRRPGAHMVTTLAGPMVNVAICAVCSVILALWIGRLGAIPWNPLHPTIPVDPLVFPTTGQEWVLRVYGTSYFILMINLLPVFPFDGGRVVQAWVWSRKGYRAATELAAGTGMVGAIIIALLGLFTEQSWLLLMIAVYGYVTCWQTRQALRDEPEYAMDELGFGGAEPRPRRLGLRQRWRLRRARARAERERRQVEEHQKAFEEVLRKVSRSGLASLTPKEKAVLEEETRRRRAVEERRSPSSDD